MSRQVNDLETRPPAARRLREKRRKQGWSVPELSQTTEVPRATLYRWERTGPTEGEYLRRVCEVLRTTPGHILDGDRE